MRNTFARVITELSTERDDICLLSGDIGNRMFEGFKKVSPDRFFNCGIAEANMMSVASGMALSGLRPFVYTITPFTTTRCLEQIKIGVAYHDSPVVIVGTGSGLSYSELGATHHSLEDIAIMRAIPEIRILAPCDSVELEAHIRNSACFNGPTYIRIGKKGEPDLHGCKTTFEVGRGNEIRKGAEVCIIGYGPILIEAIMAANDLEADGYNVGVVSMSSIRPFDHALLKRLNEEYKHILVLEEHGTVGGLWSLVAESLVEKEYGGSKLHNKSAGEGFIHHLGNQAFSRELKEIDRGSLGRYIKGVVKSTR